MKTLLVLVLALFLTLSAHADVEFDGVDDLASSAVNATTWASTSTGTFMVRVFPTATPGNTGSACHSNQLILTTRNFGAALGQKDATLCGAVFDSATRAHFTSTITVNTWYHLALTWGSGTIVVYLDGIQVGTTGSITALLSFANLVDIGGDEGGTDFFTGRITDPMIFSTVLDSTEVNRIAKSWTYGIRKSQPGASWRLSDCTNGTSCDAVAFRNSTGVDSVTGNNGANNTGLTGRAHTKMRYIPGVMP